MLPARHVFLHRRASAPLLADFAEGYVAKVLFVDDDPGVRDVFVKLLQYQGHDTHPAGNGETALEALGDDSFDVLITDQKLPGMRGIELATRVQGLGLRASVIIMTGQLTQELIEQAAKINVFECVAKPVTGEQVGRVIERAVLQR
jgi:DNA-binding NtrC family response regulator